MSKTCPRDVQGRGYIDDAKTGVFDTKNVDSSDASKMSKQIQSYRAYEKSPEAHSGDVHGHLGHLADEPAAYLFVVRPEKGFVGASPIAIRLRAALKHLLRSHGLRCTAVEPVHESDKVQVHRARPTVADGSGEASK